MNFTDVFSNLVVKLENSLNCPICNKKCEGPIRIKTCGHYFCEECLKKSKKNHNCPKCNEFYEIKHLDYKNIARESREDLLKLQEILKNIKSNKISNVKLFDIPKNTEPSDKSVKDVLDTSDNVFTYDNNKYHVNFIKGIIKKNAKGETPLHLACKKKKFDDVKKLVEKGVDINAKDYAGWAPIHEAVQSESLEIVEYLLQEGCLIDIPGTEYVTPLHQAASLNNIDIVKLLLRHGADKNLVDYTGLRAVDSTKNEAIKNLLESSNNKMERKTFQLYLSSKVCLYCHTIDDDQKKKLEECLSIDVVDKMDMKKKLTHFVIKKTHKLSFKIMQAMLEGLQFLTQDSINDFIAGDYFINIPEYNFFINNMQLNDGIQKSMISALLKLPKLFEGVSFYIEDHIKPVSIYHLKVDKEYITKLINAGGGHVLHRAPATRTCESEFFHPFFAPQNSETYRCCNFIIYAENNVPELLYNMKELQHKSSKWLIDCIVKYEISD